MTEKCNCKPILYCECDFFNQYILDCIDSGYPLWISDHIREPKCDWLFWQCTDGHDIEGVPGTVDLNIFGGTEKEFESILLK